MNKNTPQNRNALRLEGQNIVGDMLHLFVIL